MLKHVDTGHGATFARAIMLGLLALCCYGIAKADDGTHSAPSFARAASTPADDTIIEIHVEQYLSTETVMCTSTFAGVDLSQYGNVHGIKCERTADLSTTPATWGGHVNADFAFNDGTRWTMTGCRVDSVTISEGYSSIALNCL